MKTKLRRLTAMALTLSMVVSMIGIIPALAASSQDQIYGYGGSDYLYYAQDGSVITTEDAIPDGTDNPSVNAQDYVYNRDYNASIEVSKVISSTNTENEFEITLTVATTENLETLDISADAAVTLIIDASASMYYNDNMSVDYASSATNMRYFFESEDDDAIAEGTKVERLPTTGVTGTYAGEYIYIGTENGQTYYYYEVTTTTGSRPSVTTTKEVKLDTLTDDVEAYLENHVNISDDYMTYVMGQSAGNFDYTAITYLYKNLVPIQGSNYSDWRITQAQTEANAFIDNFMDVEDSVNRYVSAVVFSETATSSAWVDTATDAKALINAISPISFTNMDAGLEAANTLLTDNSAASKVDNKYAILLADGESNRYTDDKGTVQSTSTSIATQEAASAALVKNNAVLYTLAFSESLSDTMTFGDYNYSAKNDNDLAVELEKIELAIQSKAEAWTVTDPMGLNIVMGEVEGNSNSYSLTTDGTGKTSGFKWNLQDSERTIKTSSGTTTYTYTLTYDITLDTDANTFEEGTYYLTNGRTYLNYAFYKFTDGELDDYTEGTVNFKVPAVTGEYPDYTYNVRHYLQTGINEDGSFIYTEEIKDAKTDIDVSKNETVSHSENSYENYTFNAAASDNGDQKIEVNGQTLEFYYDKNTTTATVNHYYYTVTESNSGAEVVLEEPITTKYESLVYIGEDYEALTANRTNYTQITEAPDADGDYKVASTNNVTIELVEDGAENVVNYYYVYSVDNRTDVTIDVTHEYNTYSWKLDSDGRYEEYLASTETVTIPTITQKYGTTFTATERNEDGFSYVEYTDDKGSFDGLNIDSLTKASSITLVYENRIENPNEIVTATVTHVYETVKTYVDTDGATKTTTITDGTTVETYDESFEYRTGETFTAYESDSYEGNSYESYSVSPEMSITLIDGTNEIVIKYTRSVDAKVSTEVTVYHSYISYEEVINEETGKANWVVAYESGDIKDETQSTSDVYVNQYFTAYAVNLRNNKNFNMTTDISDLTIQLTSGSNAIYIEYVLYGAELEDATINVTHTYYTNTYTWADGVYGYETTTQYGDTVKYTGDDGEHYTVEEELSFDGYDWTRLDTNSLDAKLDADVEEQSINLSYYRDIIDITEAGVTVNHYYTETITEVIDGAVTTYDVKSETLGELVTETENGTLYAGMSYTATEEANGFTPAATNDTNLILAEGNDNVINLYYAKSTTDLESTTVQVIHNYTTNTITLVDDEPTSSASTSVVEEALISDKYIGEYFTATANANGFTQLTDSDEYTNITLVEGENVINIYYEKTNDFTASATLDVTHVYTTKYETGATVIKTFHDEQVSSWATVAHVFSVDTNEDLYEVTDISSDNDSVDEDLYTIVLEAGENSITIEYSRYVDDRTPSSVVVNHYYSTTDDYTNITTNDGKTTATYNVYIEDETYTAAYEYDFTVVTDETETTYTYDYLTGSRTIDIDPEDSSLNVINLYYVRNIDSTPEVTPDPDPEPEPDEEEDDTTSGGGSSTTYHSLTVTYVDEDGNELADSEYTNRIKNGSAYEAELKDIEAYVFLELHEDSDAASGTIRSDKYVIYVYTSAIDIEDGDVPQGDTPDTDSADTTDTTTTDTTDEILDITGEEVPLADVPVIEEELLDLTAPEVPLSDAPQTGDSRNLTLLVATSALSAAGIFILAKQELADRKRRSESN